MNYFSAMIRNPSGKQYDQHCGPSGEQGGGSSRREVCSYRFSVRDMVELCLGMTVSDVVQVIGKPAM